MQTLIVDGAVAWRRGKNLAEGRMRAFTGTLMLIAAVAVGLKRSPTRGSVATAAGVVMKSVRVSATSSHQASGWRRQLLA
jgi:hypothetical protein